MNPSVCVLCSSYMQSMQVLPSSSYRHATRAHQSRHICILYSQVWYMAFYQRMVTPLLPHAGSPRQATYIAIVTAWHVYAHFHDCACLPIISETIGRNLCYIYPWKEYASIYNMHVHGDRYMYMNGTAYLISCPRDMQIKKRCTLDSNEHQSQSATVRHN